MPFELFSGTPISASTSSTPIIQTPPSSNIATGTYPGSIMMRPQGDFAYTPNANDDTISQYSRNSTTGALTALVPPTVACPQTNNSGVGAMAPNGSWLYVLEYSTGIVRPFSVDAGTGQLTALATVTCATGDISGMAISPDSAFLYVFSLVGSCIYQFSINQTTGVLTPLGTPSVAVTGGESNPSNAIYMHGTGKFIYGTSSLGVWINRWTRNTTTGLLTAAAGFDQGVGFTTEGAGVVGNYFYSANSIINGRGLRYYSINTTTGVLTLNGTFADGDLSAYITSSPDATYFYNTTSNGLFIKQYLVGANGSPSLLASIAFAGGSTPWATTIVGSNVYVSNVATNTLYVYATTASSSASLEPDYRTTGPGYLKQSALGSSITVGGLNASDLSTGTLPLARLVGITTSQLDAVAGITSGQIAGLAITKLTTGTLTTGLALDWGSAAGTGTVTAGSTQIFNGSAGLTLNVQTGKAVYVQINAVEWMRYSSLGIGLSKPLYFQNGSMGSLGSNFGLTYNAPVFDLATNAGGSFRFLINQGVSQTLGLSTITQSNTGLGGVASALVQTLQALANSSTTTIMTVATTRNGWLYVTDNTGQYCRLRVIGTAAPTIEVGSANFVVAGSATSAQLAWNVSGANLQLILGSAAATSLSFVWIGTP